MLSKNLAIMLTNIKDFTERSTDSTRLQNRALLAEHEAAFQFFHGVIVKATANIGNEYHA